VIKASPRDASRGMRAIAGDAELPGSTRAASTPGRLCVGVVEKSRILDGKRVKAGAWSSAWPPAALERLLAGAQGVREQSRAAAGARAARPTRIYVKDCLALGCDRRACIRHVTAVESGNFPRAAGGHRALLKRAPGRSPDLERIQRRAGADAEMLRTFNLASACAPWSHARAPRPSSCSSVGTARFRDRRRRGRARLPSPRWCRLYAPRLLPRAPARICRPFSMAAPPGRSRQVGDGLHVPGPGAERPAAGSRPCCSSTSIASRDGTIESWCRATAHGVELSPRRLMRLLGPHC